MTEQLSFSGAIATEELVGRSYELDQIHAAIKPPDPTAFRCVLLKGQGGKGKTRLLREVAWQLGAPEEPSGEVNRRTRSWQIDKVVALPLIDVADPRLHAVVPFLREVRRGFQSFAWISADSVFGKFDRALAEYDRARDIGIAPSNTGNTVIVDAFMGAYNAVAASFRIVWVIDTMEQLFPPPIEIDSLFNELSITAADIGLTTYDWLIKYIVAKPRNTTIILAGRPEPGTWAKDIERAAQPAPQLDTRLPRLRDSLKQHLTAPADINDSALVQENISDRSAKIGVEPTATITLDLKDFELPETEAYLGALYEQLVDDLAYQGVAEYLEAFREDPDQTHALHLLTAGNPVRLALYIDLLVNVDTYPDEFRYDLATLLAMDEAQLETLRGGIDNALLQYLSQRLGGPTGQVLEYLAITRRGLDLTRLIHIWGGDEEEAKSALAHLRRLSFVKYRADGRYFLHDEFYTIYQRGFALENAQQRETSRAYRNGVFHKLIGLCDSQYKWRTQQIYDKTPKFNEMTLRKQKADQDLEFQSEYSILKHEIEGYRRGREQLLAEKVHYSLYLNPITGFQDEYYELVEQVLSAYDLELAAQLQAEVDVFFFGIASELNRQQTELPQADWDLLRFAVIYDRITSWIRRLSRLGQYNQVKNFTEQALTQYDELVRYYNDFTQPLGETADGQFLRNLAHMEWQAHQLNVAVLQGKEITNAIGDLEQIAQNFYSIAISSSQDHGLVDIQVPTLYKRLRNTQAYCLLSIGYGYTTLSLFKQAEQNYTEADQILLETGLEVLLARVKNDLSRVLGELGAMDHALSLCDEGMRIRRSLGFDNMRALSFNTMALIYNRNARQREAQYHAEEALTLFRQLDNNQRGIGLASLQLAEALRRICNFQVGEERRYGSAFKRQYDTLLNDAKSHLQTAETIFANTIQEDIRLLEVKIELGCLYRDWAALLKQKPGDEYFTGAENYFNQAIDIAENQQLEQWLLAAQAGKAWLYKKCGLNAAARDLARQIVEQVAPIYKLGSPELIEHFGASNVMIFRYLSKIYSLLATIPEEQPEQFDTILEYLVLAIVYQRLFSIYESWFLRVNLRTLYSFLSRFKSQFPEHHFDVWRQIDAIKQKYRLPELERRIQTLQFDDIIQEVFPRIGAAS